MTTQEILASLSQLEKELESIESARLLAGQTVTAYKEVQEDIKSFFSEFQKVIGTLNTVSKAFDSEKTALTNDVRTTIDVLKGQLNTLNSSFANQCNAVVLGFVNSSNEATEAYKTKLDSISSDYSKNNDTFKKHIGELSSVQDTITKAIEYVATLKSDIAALQSQLMASQKQQDTTLQEIASELKATGTKHSEILTTLSSDLKKSQDAQDEDLDELKEAHKRHSNQVEKVIETQNSIEKRIESTTSSIINLGGTVENKFESSNKNVENVSKSVKTLLYINIVLSVIAILIALFK